MNFKDLAGQSSAIEEMQDKLRLAVAKGLDWSRTDLAQLRRSNLEEVRSPVKVEFAGPPITLSKKILTFVETIQFPENWDLDRIESEIVQCVRTWVLSSSKISNEIIYLVYSDGVNINIAFASDNSTLDGRSKSSVEARLSASFPGVSFKAQNESKTPESIISRFNYAKVFTGIPVSMHNDSRQVYSLNNIIRGMRGLPFAVVISARKKSTEQLQDLLVIRTNQRSENWERIRREITDQIGVDQSKTLGLSVGAMGGVMSAVTNSVTESVTKGITNGFSKGGNGSFSFLTAPWGVGTVITMGGNAGPNNSDSSSSTASNTSSNTSGKFGGGQVGLNYSVTNSKSQSVASSQEKLNAFAEAYDSLLKDHISRLNIALSEGAWDTSAFIFGEKFSDTQLAYSLWYREVTGDFEPIEAFRDFDVIRKNDVIESLSLSKDSTTKADLYTLLTSSELAALINLPSESHPGVEVRSIPRFTMNFPATQNGDCVDFGTVLDRDVPLHNVNFKTSVQNFCSHTLVAGITGSGKTTTVKNLIGQLHDIPFVVIEPAKSEYRQLVNAFDNLQVYTFGDEEVSPFRLNPFELPEDGNILSHVDALTSIINAAFPMEGPMSSLVEQAILASYEEKGWNIDIGRHPGVVHGQQVYSAIPTMSEFYYVLKDLISKQGYAGDYGANISAALLTRIRSLCIGPRGNLFNTNYSVNIQDIVSKPTVLELKNLGSDDSRSFAMGLLLHRVYKYFENECANSFNSGKLRCLLIVEEAHRLFKRTSSSSNSIVGNNSYFHSVELFENIMAEARSFGLGVVVVDQLPLRLSESAIKNTSTKIIHRLTSVDDAVEMGGSMGLNPDDSSFISRLRQGQVLIHRADMERPAHVSISYNFDVNCKFISSDDLKAHSILKGYSLRKYTSHTLEELFRSVVNDRPDKFVSLADSFVTSLIIGSLDEPSLERLVGQAEDIVFDIGHSYGLKVSDLDAVHFIKRACEERIRKTWYLQKKPLLLDQAINTWNKIFIVNQLSPLKCIIDADSVLNFRKLLSDAGRGVVSVPVSLSTRQWVKAQKFLPDCAGWAQVIASQISIDMFKGENDLLDGLSGIIINKLNDKILSKTGELVPYFAITLFVLSAEHLISHPVPNELMVKAFNAFSSFWC